MEQVQLFGYWLVNGILALIYLIVEQALLLLLLPPLGWLALTGPEEQRIWTTTAGILTLLTAGLAPSPVPFWLLVMAIAGSAAAWAERFDPRTLRWRVTQGLSLYSLAGIGFMFYQEFGPLRGAGNTGALMSQGESYLNAIIAVAMYVIPLGFLAMLAQAVWAHAPLGKKPEEIIRDVRARGKN